MRWQSTGNNCGPATVANVLMALGREISESHVEKIIAKVNRKVGNAKETDGTDTVQIKSVLEMMNCTFTEFNLSQPDAAWAMLRHFLMDGKPVILCVENNSHWVGAVGILGKRVLIADPVDNDLVISMESDKLIEWWGNKSDVTQYYGLPVIAARKR